MSRSVQYRTPRVQVAALGDKPGGGSPALIAFDWGTSACRAFLLDGDGDFAAAFDGLTATWRAQHAIAAGMIGSAQGWVEAPYCAVPAGVDHLAALTAVPSWPLRMTSAAGMASTIFSARSLVLTEKLSPEQSLEYLSGLLIGDELRCGLAPGGRPTALIGDGALCARCATALAIFEISNVPVVEGAAHAGLWRIAQHAGLTSGVSKGDLPDV